jgi:choice-of-anchor C domain-containing protein
MKHTDVAIEKRKWYKNIMAIIAIISALAGAVYGVIQILYSPAFKIAKVQENIQIVLDSSDAMAKPFDGSTKLEAARKAVEKSLALQIADKDNLAFRLFGGDCSKDNSQLIVDFGQHNKETIRNALKNITLDGRTTLASGVIEATGDFNDPERFGGVNKTIIVITGGKDPCHPDAPQFIEDRLTRAKIEMHLRFIGMGLKPDEKDQLTRIAENTGGRAFFPDNQEELTRAVQKVLEVQNALPGQNIVRNGDFESPVVSGQHHDTYTVGQTFDGWGVSKGSIDLVKTWQHASGNQSVDLSGNEKGVMFQDIDTVPGETYTLRFAMAGNPGGTGIEEPPTKRMRIFWNGSLIDTLLFDTAGKSESDMGWRYHQYTVTATKSVTRLEFVSLTGDRTGPTVDDVSVTAEPKASSVGIEEPSQSQVFETDTKVLAKFEFNGDLNDSSGNGRHARLLGGEFVETPWGQGLHVSRTNKTGIDWSAFANLLVSPYTIEIVLTPSATGNWGKLFSFEDANDRGWYYKDKGIQAYPHPVRGGGKVHGNEQHYLAFVSTDPNTVDVYFQGSFIGSTNASFKAPPPQAIFFRDDTRTGRQEQIDAVVEALRVSNISRTPEEIAAIQRRLAPTFESRPRPPTDLRVSE